MILYSLEIIAYISRLSNRQPLFSGCEPGNFHSKISTKNVCSHFIRFKFFIKIPILQYIFIKTINKKNKALYLVSTAKYKTLFLFSYRLPQFAFWVINEIAL